MCLNENDFSLIYNDVEMELKHLKQVCKDCMQKYKL